jgi:hypothetical protein
MATLRQWQYTVHQVARERCPVTPKWASKLVIMRGLVQTLEICSGLGGAGTDPLITGRMRISSSDEPKLVHAVQVGAHGTAGDLSLQSPSYLTTCDGSTCLTEHVSYENLMKRDLISCHGNTSIPEYARPRLPMPVHTFAGVWL